MFKVFSIAMLAILLPLSAFAGPDCSNVQTALNDLTIAQGGIASFAPGNAADQAKIAKFQSDLSSAITEVQSGLVVLHCRSTNVAPDAVDSGGTCPHRRQAWELVSAAINRTSNARWWGYMGGHLVNALNLMTDARNNLESSMNTLNCQ